MKRLFIILFLIIALCQLAQAGSKLIQVAELPNGAKFLDNKFIVVSKYDTPPFRTNISKSGYAVTGVQSVDLLCLKMKVAKVEPFYKGNLRKPVLAREVSRIYIFTLGEGEKALSAITVFNKNFHIEYAELYYIPELFYIPNDPYVDQQWHLAHTRTFEAWDIVRGDTTRHSIIGIIDTGVNWENDDLITNIWVNEPEDLNGNGTLDFEDLNNVDDDGNGFIDDVIGWDFGDDDNNPSEYNMNHGSAVAGCASEATDNNLGCAGMGFSARIMCLKAMNYQGYFVNYLQALIYAADNGAHIVNCSWGWLIYSQTEQAVFNYLWEEDVLSIAGAGAHSNNQEIYPAAYDHVMAVASTDQNDHLASFSSYGEWIDICAPGVNILVIMEDGFSYVSGTSFSAPMVAGLAGLVRAWYPELTNDETQLLIENAADSIDHLNPWHEGMLGAGRINSEACFATTGIDDINTKPNYVTLSQNYPNPFNISTTIQYNLPFSSQVNIDIYDILGHKVEALVDIMKPAGFYRITWNAENFSSGIYFYRLQTREYSQTKKMILLK